MGIRFAGPQRVGMCDNVYYFTQFRQLAPHFVSQHLLWCHAGFIKLLKTWERRSSSKQRNEKSVMRVKEGPLPEE